jgi:DNA modification methylase
MPILTGDCRTILPTLPPDSIDACVTDPPCELSFMGQKWDGTGIAFNPDTWREVYRVLRPGARLIVMGGTRTHHRL